MNVSVIIPHYNQTQYLEEAISSVLSQTLPAHEIIVIDDSSTVSLDFILDKYGQYIRLIQQPNAGSSQARNCGVLAATSKYIAFLDADDLWHPEKLAQQSQYLKKYPDDMIFCMVQNFFCDSLTAAARSRLQKNITNPIPGLTPSCFLVSKENMLKIGLMKSHIKTGEFIEWYIRATGMGLQARVLPETLVYRRMHAGHIGKGTQHLDYCKILYQKIRQKTPS